MSSSSTPSAHGMFHLTSAKQGTEWMELLKTTMLLNACTDAMEDWPPIIPQHTITVHHKATSTGASQVAAYDEEIPNPIFDVDMWKEAKADVHEYNKRDQKLQGIIHQWVTPNLVKQMVNDHNEPFILTKEMVDFLREKYCNKSGPVVFTSWQKNPQHPSDAECISLTNG